MHIDLPYHLDARGRTAEVNDDGYVRDLIEQVLFTMPGERVNRPDFGTGLMQLVFGPNSDELAATIQLLTRSALQQWLGDLIRVEDVLAESIDSTLTIEVRYTRVLSQESTTVRFVRPV
jgi:phage baseplate assembly protein W